MPMRAFSPTDDDPEGVHEVLMEKETQLNTLKMHKCHKETKY